MNQNNIFIKIKMMMPLSLLVRTTNYYINLVHIFTEKKIYFYLLDS